MKECQKWWNEKYPRAKEFSGHKELEIAAYEGWRAALEWALSRIRDRSISYEQGHNEIEKELET